MLRLPCGQCCASFSYSAGSAGSKSMARAVRGRDGHDDRLGGDVAAVGADGDGAVGVPLDAPDDRVRARTRAPSSSAIRSAICWVPPGKRSCWAPPSTSSIRPEPARGLDVAHGVQHRHLVGLAAPGHPRHDRHQVACRRARRARERNHRSSVWSSRLSAIGGGPRLGDRDLPADPLEPPLDPGHVDQLEHRQPGMVLRYDADPAAPADQVLAAAVGRHRLAAQFGRQLEDRVLRRADERAAEVDGHAGDRRGRRPAADPVAALEHDDVVSEPDQFARRGQPREPRPHDDDVGAVWHSACSLADRLSASNRTRLSREGDDGAVRTHRCDRAGAGPARRRGQRGLHLRGTARRVRAADAGVDGRRAGPDDQRRDRVSAQPDSSRPPGDRPPAAQRRAGSRSGWAPRSARRSRSASAPSSTSRWTG